MPSEAQFTQEFDPDHIMDEWRRLYDWAVFSRQSPAFIEEVSILGQQFSSLLNGYRHTTAPRRRERLCQELEATFTTMQTLYHRLDKTTRIPLHFRHE